MMATQYAKASYEEIIDCHTEEGHVTAIGIHTPTGDTPRKMFSGFFEQFKKFKYLGCSIKLVPAARLPADPLQVSYEPGQVIGTAVDPRDMLNPFFSMDVMETILVRYSTHCTPVCRSEIPCRFSTRLRPERSSRPRSAILWRSCTTKVSQTRHGKRPCRSAVSSSPVSVL